MKLHASLTSASIRQMAKELTNYETELREKIRLFRTRLADKGILVAQANVSQGFSSYIMFYRQESENTSYIVAKEMAQLISSWLRGNEEVYAYVSPLLMSEFGAGQFAVYWEDAQGTPHPVLSDGTMIGRGSFPDQKHAFQDSWWYMDLNREWHQVRGTKPTRPMHNAVLEIITQVNSTAREVFGNG